MDNSGLHHLANAATALTQLTEAQSKSPATKRSRTNAVSDDDERPSVVDTEPSQQTEIESSKSSKSALDTIHSDGSKQIFPQRLMHMLNEKSISDIITWLPHGQSFVIVKPTVFTETILPLYFPESCTEKKSQKASSSAAKYPSFTRKLNRWGFRQVSRGADAGAFHHKLFLRDKPEKCLQMVCQRSRRRKNDKKNVEERSDRGSVEIFISPRITTDIASHGNESKRKLGGLRDTLVTDSESDTSSTLTNEAKSLPPKKRKHCVNTKSSETVAHTSIVVTPPRPKDSSVPIPSCMTTKNTSIRPDSPANHISDNPKAETSLTLHTSTHPLLHPPSETYLDASALIQHNLALNSLQTLNAAAVAMAHIQTLTLTQNACSAQLHPLTTNNLPSSNIAIPSMRSHENLKSHANLKCSSESGKEKKAQSVAITAKKMLYSAFLDALK